MINLNNIKRRWNIIKKLIYGDEYFICIANPHKEYNNIITYDYICNTNRSIFYKFIHDYIETNKLNIINDNI